MTYILHRHAESRHGFTALLQRMEVEIERGYFLQILFLGARGNLRVEIGEHLKRDRDCEDDRRFFFFDCISIQVKIPSTFPRVGRVRSTKLNTKSPNMPSNNLENHWHELKLSFDSSIDKRVAMEGVHLFHILFFRSQVWKAGIDA